MPHDPYYLHDPATGRLRFTATGRRALGPRFARAGIDLKSINTLDQARAAAAEVAHRELRALAADLKGRDPALDAAMAELPEWGGLALAEQLAQRDRFPHFLQGDQGVGAGQQTGVHHRIQPRPDLPKLLEAGGFAKFIDFPQFHDAPPTKKGTHRAPAGTDASPGG